MSTAVNGAAIRAIRQRSGLSVRDMVARLHNECEIDVHEDHIRNVEVGARGASEALAKGLSHVLRVPVVAILAVPAPEHDIPAAS